jgi:hypothetical protein
VTVKTAEITLDTSVTVSNTPKTKRAPRITMPPFKITQDNMSGDRFVEEMDRKLVEALRDATSDIDGLYDDKPRIPVESMFDELGTLKAHVERYGKNVKLTQLIRYLEDAHAEQMARVRNMMDRGVVSFGALRLLLRPNTNVVITGDHDVGGRVVNSRYRQSAFGAYLEIDYEYITSNGREFRTTTAEIMVGAYVGVKPIHSLSVRPATDVDRASLSERGRVYAEVAVGAHYKQFVGQMQVLKWWSYSPMRATGRCMIDIATHNQFKDEARYRPGREDSVIKQLQDDQLWQTDPYVTGFSFVTKQWGRFPVAQISNIEFRDNAYDQLVLDAQKKDMVRALVQDNSSGFSDIISGKGGGCIFLLHGEPGVGKAQPLGAIVQTPDGPRKMGELQVGDSVYAADGTSVKILGVYPQGVRPVYEFTFVDGRKVRADEQHLWKVKMSHGKSKTHLHGGTYWDTVSTKRLIDRSRTNGSPVYVPLASAYQTSYKEFPVDPWLLGIMIGDGFMKYKHCSVSNTDEEIINRVRSLLPENYKIRTVNDVDHHIQMVNRKNNETHWLKDALKELCLYGLGSHERFVPEIYFQGSVEQRLELVRGLMDSDGYVAKNKVLNYTTTSLQLAKDFQRLIWGLGGIAHIKHQTTSYYSQGHKIQCRDAYTVSIRHPDPQSLVFLSRKKERLQGHHQYSETLALKITNIEKIGEEATQCILIDHPTHLYLTEDWVVTHNTLTAEAVSELLRRPLYSVSVGELGTDPVSLEKNMRQILDVAQIWNAVILIDEADIFLEKRATGDVVRNGMVSIFLRLLEYHQGVMFLTTNRVEEFDPAFYSRISVALRYETLSTQAREQIWRNLLSAAGVHDMDVSQLATHDLNGRQIKNLIRLSQSLARQQGVPVSMVHVQNCLTVGREFLRDSQTY